MSDLFMTLYRLKDELRAGWVLRGIERPESVADHSWGTALLCLLHGPEAGVEVPRAVAMALIHDLAEAVTGDRAARMGPNGEVVHEADKAEREERAFAELFPVGRESFGTVRELHREYEETVSSEARFVRDMNLVDMCLQALIYESEQRYDPTDKQENFPAFRRLEEFFATSAARLSTEIGRRLFEGIFERYRALAGSRRDRLDPGVDGFAGSPKGSSEGP